MTVAVSLKVHEGVVLAADSASTLMGIDQNGQQFVVNVYENANKIANLVKGLPLGVITWGAGAIGPESISTLFKDIRRMFTGQVPGPAGADWTVDHANYSVADVATRVREFIYDIKYQGAFGAQAAGPELGMVVAGYSSAGTHAEEYLIDIQGTQAPAPQRIRPGAECGYVVGGQATAVARLIEGVDPQLADVLHTQLAVSAPEAQQATSLIKDALRTPVVMDAMPFKDAIDLAEFFVDLTCKFSRFNPGASTVGGPIELAGITKHEGFKWIKRKHYYGSELNPLEG